LDRYFRYGYVGKTFTIEKIHEYPDSLLRNRNHAIYLGWLLADKKAYKTFNSIYHNYINLRRFEFDFHIDKPFSLDARYSITDNIIRIEQIYACLNMQLPFEKLIY
jgi:hypothetical protein